jgi:hypothetical protein
MVLASRITTSRLKLTAITLVCFAVCLVLLVQIDRCLLHYRAVRLLNDFHSIRLRQSTWSDAQRLMSRWGAYGHYDGTCTTNECTYFITLMDVQSRIERPLDEYMAAHYPQSYSGITLGHIFSKLGSRYAHIRVGFLVKDGIIQRSRIAEIIGVASSDPSCDMNCDSYALILQAVANDHLLAHQEDFWILGDEEQLAQHPDFKVGRPSGCESCMEVSVTFTPHVSQKELEHITAYNMSCFAALHVCRTLPEVLPAASDWQLYGENAKQIPYDDPTSKPCSVPIFALARDMPSVLLVDAISTQTVVEHESDNPRKDRSHQKTAVQLISVLKGTDTLAASSQIIVVPFAGYFDAPLYQLEDLHPQKRYLIFTNEYPNSSSIELPHCGVVEYSPQAEAEVQKGIAMNDHIHFRGDNSPW